MRCKAAGTWLVVDSHLNDFPPDQKLRSMSVIGPYLVWPPGRLVPVEFGPRTGLGGFLDGFAEKKFVVAGGEGGEAARGFEVAGSDVVVEVMEKLDEGVGVAFGVAAGVGGIGASGRAEQ